MNLSIFVIVPLLMLLGLWLARNDKQVRGVMVVGASALLEHHFLFQDNATYTIKRRRHLITIKLTDVLMTHRTEVIALVLVRYLKRYGVMGSLPNVGCSSASKMSRLLLPVVLDGFSLKPSINS